MTSARSGAVGGLGSAPDSPPLVVVVVTYNSSADIAGFLASVLDSPGPPRRVVVVDNASADDTCDLVQQVAESADGAVQLVRLDDNLGYAAGINAAIAHAGPASGYLIANPDVRLRPGCLDALVAAGCDPRVGVVLPRLVGSEGELQASLRREPSLVTAIAEAVLGGRLAAQAGLSEVIVDERWYRAPVEAAWATGALLLITPRCVERVGSWDETFFLYSEETDLLLRVRDAGLRNRYEPAAVAVHRGGAAHREPDLWSLLTTNRVRLYARRYPRWKASLFWTAVLLNEALRAPRSPTHRAAVRSLIRRRRALLSGAAPR